MPNDATVEDCKAGLPLVLGARLEGQRALRDGSKLSQPLNSQLISDDDEKTMAVEAFYDKADGRAHRAALGKGVERLVERIVVMREREKMPDRRKGYTQKPWSAATKGLFRTGEYDDGRIGVDFHRHAQGRRGVRSFINNFAIAARSACIRRAAGGICRRLHLSPASSPRGRCRATIHQVRDLDPRYVFPRARGQLHGPL